MFLSVLACAAFTGSAFASNEVVEVENLYSNDGLYTNFSKEDTDIHIKYTCNISIYYTDIYANERPLHQTKYFYFVSTLQGAGMCLNHANSVAQN